jgi:hypothetical protein
VFLANKENEALLSSGVYDENKSLWGWFFSQHLGLLLEQLEYLGLLLEQLGQQHLGCFIRTAGQQHLDCLGQQLASRTTSSLTS